MKISTNKIIIGTAQMSRNYGVTNFQKYEKRKKIKILEFAWDSGIRSFDTAPYYGNAEKILGEFIKINNLKDEIKIYTKIDIQNYKKNFIDNINFSVSKSLKVLKVDKLECVYVSNNFCINNIDNKIISNIKKNLNVKKVGASIYNDVKKISLIRKKFDLFQVPINIALKNNFKYLKEQKIIARSIFLQGLLLNKKVSHKIPRRLQLSLNKYFNFLKKIEMTPLEISLSFINDLKKIPNFIIPIDKKLQLKKILNTDVKKLNKDHCSAIINLFNISDLDPRKWK